MTIVAAHVAIENKFATEWASATDIKYENVDFDIPTTSWVELQIRFGKGSKISLGDGVQLRRTVGTLFVNVYTPKSGGAKPSNTLVDSAIAIFRDLVVSNVTFYEASVNVIGEKYYPSSGSGVSATTQWWETVIGIPFKYDEYV